MRVCLLRCLFWYNVVLLFKTAKYTAGPSYTYIQLCKRVFTPDRLYEPRKYPLANEFDGLGLSRLATQLVKHETFHTKISFVII